MAETLAVKYRPKTFDSVIEQSSIIAILKNQLRTNTIKNAYLFCGSAGTGKTTCARIFANEINGGKGTPIEIDAASNNGVDNVRQLIDDAKKRSLDSEYKVYILDECHSLTTQSWQAFLKLIEEPPKYTIFIFCTTDPQKIPRTILSRVQRYNFSKITLSGIIMRLNEIIVNENIDRARMDKYVVTDDALTYIAQLANGGMRDAIRNLDKCLSLKNNIDVGDVVSAIGVATFAVQLNVVHGLCINDNYRVLSAIDKAFELGVDMKLFAQNILETTIDVIKYKMTHELKYTNITSVTEEQRICMDDMDSEDLRDILPLAYSIYSDTRYAENPKVIIESRCVMFIVDRR